MIPCFHAARARSKAVISMGDKLAILALLLDTARDSEHMQSLIVLLFFLLAACSRNSTSNAGTANVPKDPL